MAKYVAEYKKKIYFFNSFKCKNNQKVFKRWIKFPKLSKTLFKIFDICLTSDKDSKRYLKILGAKNIKYIGNLKFSQREKSQYT